MYNLDIFLPNNFPNKSKIHFTNITCRKNLQVISNITKFNQFSYFPSIYFLKVHFRNKKYPLNKSKLKNKKKIAEIFFVKNFRYILMSEKILLEKKSVNSESIKFLPFLMESVLKKKLSTFKFSGFFIFQYTTSIFLNENNIIFLAKINTFESKRKLKKIFRFLALNLKLLRKF